MKKNKAKADDANPLILIAILAVAALVVPLILKTANKIWRLTHGLPFNSLTIKEGSCYGKVETTEFYVRADMVKIIKIGKNKALVKDVIASNFYNGYNDRPREADKEFIEEFYLSEVPCLKLDSDKDESEK